MQTRRYLVTGGAGFVGSHLCDRLLDAGHEVLSLDDLSTGSAANLAHLSGHPRFRSIVGSVRDRSLVASVIAETEVVFHLAAAVGVDLILQRRVDAIETNVIGSATVLELCSERGRPVLLTSSSEVYGKGNGVPFREDQDITFGSTGIARWSYGCGKALDEFLALAHARERGLPVTVVRLFNVAGPRQTGRYGMVLPRFVRQALAGQPLTIYGDGTQTRCFCDVADAIDALVALAGRADAKGLVVNIGSDEEVTVNELARRVRTLTGSSSEIEHVNYDPTHEGGFEDMQRRVPDLTRATALIGFRPRRRLDEIIRRVIEFERQQT